MVNITLQVVTTVDLMDTPAAATHTDTRLRGLHMATTLILLTLTHIILAPTTDIDPRVTKTLQLI